MINSKKRFKQFKNKKKSLKSGGNYNFEILLDLKSSNKYKNLISNYNDFILLKNEIMSQKHNKENTSKFWLSFLSPRQKNYLGIELEIFSSGSPTGLKLIYENLYLLSNQQNKLYEIQFHTFIPDGSNLYLPIPTKKTFSYQDIINNNKEIKSSDIILENLLQNFNQQKKWLVDNKEKNYLKILNKLFFRLDPVRKIWITNLNELYTFLGFRYNTKNPLEIDINPDKNFWEIDKSLSKDKHLLTSNSDEMGISGLKVRVIHKSVNEETKN